MRLLTFLLGVVFLSCACNMNKEKRSDYLDYRTRLDSVVSIYSTPNDSTREIDLCSLFDKTEWDSIAIIRPYLPKEYLDGVDFSAMPEAKDSMEYVINVEWMQGLLFFKRNTLSYYSVIPANPSFSKIDDLTPRAIPILIPSKCKVDLVNVVGSDGDQTFYFVAKDYASTVSEQESRKPPEGTLDSLLIN